MGRGGGLLRLIGTVRPAGQGGVDNQVDGGRGKDDRTSVNVQDEFRAGNPPPPYLSNEPHKSSMKPRQFLRFKPLPSQL